MPGPTDRLNELMAKIAAARAVFGEAVERELARTNSPSHPSVLTRTRRFSHWPSESLIDRFLKRPLVQKSTITAWPLSCESSSSRARRMAPTIRRTVRQGLGRRARGDGGAAEKVGCDSARCREHAATRLVSRLGFAEHRRKAAARKIYGELRGIHGADRSRDRPATCHHR
jgi:hypothetical protein